MTDYLDKIYDKMGRDLIVEDNYYAIDSRFWLLEHIIKKQKPGKLLDLGCGQGSLLARSALWHECHGCEYDEGARTIAKSKGLDVQMIDLNTATTLPITQKLDIIVCSEVCEHLLNPRNVLKLVKNYLADDGIFILTVPNAVPLKVRVNVLLGRHCDWLHYPSPDTETTGHIRFYTIDGLHRLASEEGFKPILTSGVSWRMNGPFWPRLYYWISKLLKQNPQTFGRKIDTFLSRLFPSLSPGLFFVLKHQ